jgi:hypothetical protein
MTRDTGKSAPEAFPEEELDPRLRDPHVRSWLEEHLPELRRSISEQRMPRWPLGIALVVGLAAHVGGYLLRPSATTEPVGFVADLLYQLGLALWTGVVVAVFVTIIPQIKQRQLKRMIDAYDRGVLREKARDGNDEPSGKDRAPPTS